MISRKIIHKFVCRYGGAEVFSVDLHEAISANPFIEFYLRATESGDFEFIWEEDNGGVTDWNTSSRSLDHEVVIDARESLYMWTRRRDATNPLALSMAASAFLFAASYAPQQKTLEALNLPPCAPLVIALMAAIVALVL